MKLLELHNINDTNLSIREPLHRIFSFVYYYTNITKISSVREDTLLSYLQFHCSNQFEELSFYQVLKDIRIFILYLEATDNIKLDVDLSIKNVYLWTMIL